jgi:periplasmic protein CpxP/Spy
MLKQSLLILLAASLISIAALAQDAPPNNQPPAQDNAGMHRGPMDPAQRTQELAKKLNLTSDQQAKVQQILQSESSQIDSLRQDSSLSQQDRRSKMMDIHQATNTQIRALLDSNQQKQWDAMQTNRGQWGHRRGAQNSTDQQAPPPQQ